MLMTPQEFLFIGVLLIDALIALATFFFAFYLLRRWKDPIPMNFGLSILSLAIWISLVLVLFVDTEFIDSIRSLILKFRLFFGILILHFFLIFTMKYPHRQWLDRKYIVPLYFLTAIFSSLIFFTNIFVDSAYLDFPFHYVQYPILSMPIYIFWFLMLSIWAFSNLLFKYALSGGDPKRNLRKVIIGTAIAVVSNLIFSMGLFLVSDFDFKPIGILFTFSVLVYIYMILFPKRS